MQQWPRDGTGPGCDHLELVASGWHCVAAWHGGATSLLGLNPFALALLDPADRTCAEHIYLRTHPRTGHRQNADWRRQPAAELAAGGCPALAVHGGQAAAAGPRRGSNQNRSGQRGPCARTSATRQPARLTVSLFWPARQVELKPGVDGAPGGNASQDEQAGREEAEAPEPEGVERSAANSSGSDAGAGLDELDGVDLHVFHPVDEGYLIRFGHIVSPLPPAIANITAQPNATIKEHCGVRVP